MVGGALLVLQHGALPLIECVMHHHLHHVQGGGAGWGWQGGAREKMTMLEENKNKDLKKGKCKALC